jgi:hypothetical protein
MKLKKIIKKLKTKYNTKQDEIKWCKKPMKIQVSMSNSWPGSWNQIILNKKQIKKIKIFNI